LRAVSAQSFDPFSTSKHALSHLFARMGVAAIGIKAHKLTPKAKPLQLNAKAKIRPFAQSVAQKERNLSFV